MAPTEPHLRLAMALSWIRYAIKVFQDVGENEAAGVLNTALKIVERSLAKSDDPMVRKAVVIVDPHGPTK